MPVVPGTPCVLCAREDSTPPARLPQAARAVPCVGCGVRVLTAPSTRDLIASGTAQPVCPECLPASVNVGVMTAGQVRDLKSFLAEDARRN